MIVISADAILHQHMTEADYRHEFCNPMISQTFADQWVLLVGKKFAKFFLYTVVNELERRLDLV